MIDFDYQAPAQLDEALALLQQHGDDARVIAGGTALVIMMKQRLVQPQLLVSLRRIPELEQVRADNGTLHLGATATHRAVETSPIVRDRWPLLAETYRHVATVRIRNMATVGGGVVHGDPNQDPPPALRERRARGAAPELLPRLLRDGRAARRGADRDRRPRAAARRRLVVGEVPAADRRRLRDRLRRLPAQFGERLQPLPGGAHRAGLRGHDPGTRRRRRECAARARADARAPPGGSAARRRPGGPHLRLPRLVRLQARHGRRVDAARAGTGSAASQRQRLARRPRRPPSERNRRARVPPPAHRFVGEVRWPGRCRACWASRSSSIVTRTSSPPVGTWTRHRAARSISTRSSFSRTTPG